MWNRSCTHVKEFILVGFPGSPYLQLTMFLFLLFAYVLTVMSNISIIILVTTHRHLHSPMYYFLCNFAFLEICFTTACVPKTLVNLGSQSQSISFTGCLLQMYFVFSFGCTEYFLLTVMAYDRYLAICYPLSYTTIMNSTLSTWLAAVSWIGGFLTISVPTFLISRLSFCGSNVINHFFCDISPWIILSCTDTSLVEMVCFIMFAVVILGSCVITLVSYTYIIYTVLKIPSAQGRRRAFSTCSSHLMVITVWYGSTIFLHVKPSIKASLELTKIITILNTVITPLLNPFIYTFRNKEVKEILKKTFSWKTESHA
ncbi:olfactory receptor 6F1 [Lagopus muta]|uniref:olfactory receptor 6F1 n=1 Tax=Lagopus muta TaxID=64668 RepID=UPI00209F4F49|nr:olfactory receptor 6F1 [Lagopus muta]